MPKLPRITGKDAVRAFEKAGFYTARIKASHHLMYRDNWPNHLSVPVHAGKTIGLGLLNSQIKAAGLTVEQFKELL